MAIDFNALYQNNLGRAPDAGGLAYWQGLANNMSEQDLKNAFYASAAKEMQKNDTGLTPATDAWDENRIAGGMARWGSDPKLSSMGNYFSHAGDTASTSAAQRLGSSPDIGDRLNKNPFAANLGYTGQAKQQMQPQMQASLGGYQKNPYLDEMAKGITSQMTQNWTNNLDPSIRSGAMAAGGFGGSRQGVVEANGLNDLNRSLGQNLTNLYGQDYTNSMNRNLQKYGMDQSYNLGLRANDLGFAGLDAQIAQNNFGNQLAGANFGLNAYGLLNQSNAGATQAGGAIQNTPQQYYNTNLTGLNQIAGNGGSVTQVGQGNPWLSALGGAQAANQIKW